LEKKRASESNKERFGLAKEDLSMLWQLEEGVPNYTRSNSSIEKKG